MSTIVTERGVIAGLVHEMYDDGIIGFDVMDATESEDRRTRAQAAEQHAKIEERHRAAETEYDAAVFRAKVTGGDMPVPPFAGRTMTDVFEGMAQADDERVSWNEFRRAVADQGDDPGLIVESTQQRRKRLARELGITDRDLERTRRENVAKTWGMSGTTPPADYDLPAADYVRTRAGGPIIGF